MKKNIGIQLLLFVLAGQTQAQVQAAPILSCEQWNKLWNVTYYCDCKDNSIPFAYGIDTVLNDTTWYTAKLLDIQQGLTAYWFSTGSVDIDIFPLCTSQQPLLSTTISKNRAYNVTSDYINEKLESLGGSTSETIKKMDIHIRVVPQAGVSGRVVMTSYDEGYHSTCANPLPLHYNMAYVLSHPDNVYQLDYTAAPQEMAVQWIQKDRQPVDIEVAMGTCDAPAFMTARLTDSAHVWLPQLTQLENAYRQNQPLFFRFSANAVGRVWFVSPFTKYEGRVDTTLCQGLSLQLSDTLLSQTTVYVDTFYLSRTDSLLLTTYNLTITPPVVEYDTMEVESTKFPFLYKGQGRVNRYGSFEYLIRTDGECDRKIELTVKQPVTTLVDILPLSFIVRPTVAMVGQSITVFLEETALLRVYDMLGNLVLEQWHEGGISSFVLSSRGNYVLQLSTDESLRQTRIVVQ